MLVVKADGSMVLLTRSADLRQARHTSIIDNIVLWTTATGANPAVDLRNLLNELDLLAPASASNMTTHGLTAYNGRRLDEQLQTFGQIADASGIVGRCACSRAGRGRQGGEGRQSLRRRARRGLAADQAGGDEALILAAMQARSLPAAATIRPTSSSSAPASTRAVRLQGRPPSQAHQERPADARMGRRLQPLPTCADDAHGADRKVSKRHQELFDAARASLLAVEKAMTPGNSFGDVFDAHARTMEAHGLTKHRLNACGYSVGARFTPSWMDMPMFYQGNPEPIAPNMTLFAHMIIMDSDTETAMTLGRTYLTTESQPKPLSPP